MKASIDLNTARRIQKFGKEYKPAELPPDLRPGRLGWCFDDCIIQLIDRKLMAKYRYVEGIARAHEIETFKLHAWLTDGEHAFDPTWLVEDNLTGKTSHLNPYGTYIGIEMPTMDVLRFMQDTEYQGIIANGWRSRKLAKKCVPDGFRLTKECHKASENPTHLLLGID